MEDAKAQLLNPNRRISEIAYDVGFQSLTQFNRMFKRVFGQSPTEFRVHLGRKQYWFAGRRVGSGWHLICLLLVGIRVSAEAAFNLEIGVGLLC